MWNAWHYFQNEMILEVEIKDAKWPVFHLISKHSLNINFFCTFSLWIVSGYENNNGNVTLNIG